MKRIIGMLLVVAALLGCLSGCGKSEEIKAVEAQIAALTENSSYKEINDVYKAYDAIEYDKRDKVENADVLAKYIDLTGGEFFLTEEMVDEIKVYFDDDKYGLRAHSSLNLDLTVKKHGTAYGKDWNKIGNYEFKSGEKTDDYTYVKYGRVEVIDKYGKKSIHDFEMKCSMKYDEESETLKISTNSEIHN